MWRNHREMCDTQPMRLEEVVKYQNDLLRVAEFNDYPNALNGLQLENSGTVSKVAAAVDACEAVLRMAVEVGADLLIAHHGLFWGGLQTVTGAHHRKLKLAIENDLAVYSVHLPLDAHPQFGNNVLLCNALDLPEPRQPFLEIGLQAEANLDREILCRRIEQAVGGKCPSCPWRTTSHAQNRSGDRRSRRRNLQGSCGGRRYLHHRRGAALVVYCRGGTQYEYLLCRTLCDGSLRSEGTRQITSGKIRTALDVSSSPYWFIKH